MDVFSTRFLTAVVNSPELDESLQPPFLLSEYFGAPEATEQDTVDILRRSGMNGMSLFNASGAPGFVVSEGIDELIQTVRFPIIREKIPLEAKDLVNMQSTESRVWRANPESIQQIQDRVINSYLTTLKKRAMNREEWMIAELLTKGIITYKNGRVAFKIDFGIDSAFFPVLSGTSRWGQSAADVNGNLEDWTNQINAASGGYGGDVIMGTTAAKLFKADPTVLKLLDNQNTPIGRVNYDANSLDVGNYNGFRIRKWAKNYKDDAGVTQPYFPANGVLMMGSTFKGRRLFGLNEEFVNGGQRPGDPYFSKSWEEEDPAVRNVLLASRPLPIAEAEGTWVFATVA